MFKISRGNPGQQAIKSYCINLAMETELYEVEPNRNAEAYRNLQQVPGHLDKHLEFIEFCDGN